MESCRSIALYGTPARSPHAAVAANNTRPANRYDESSWIRLIAAVSSTASPVSTVSARRRRCGACTHTPVTGARIATVRPATVSARPSQLAGDAPPGMPSPTDSVR